MSDRLRSTLRRTSCAAVVSMLAVVPAGAAQEPDVEALEARLPSLTGAERVRALADLTFAYRSLRPALAIERGREALALAERTPHAASQVRAYNEMAWAFMELGSMDEARAHADSGRALADLEGDSVGLARALNNRGVIERRTGGYAAAIDLFTRSMEIHEALGDLAATATSLNNLSVVYGFDLRVYEEALEHQNRALEIRLRLGEEQAIAQSYNALGVIYANMGEPAEAIRWLDRALERWRALDLPPRIWASLANKARAYQALGELERAQETLEEALALGDGAAERPERSIGLHTLGDILVDQGKLAAALDPLRASLAIKREIGDRRGEAGVLTSLARVDAEAGASQAAAVRLEEAAAIARDIGARQEERDALALLSDVLERSGDAAGALAAFRASEALADEIFNEVNALRIAGLRVAREEAERLLEIERLEGQAEVLALRVRNRTTLAVAALLLSALGFVAYHRTTTARRLSEQLELARARAERETAEQERRRAEDLARTRADFIAWVSHEIRTPMSGVVGIANVLSGTDLDPDQARFVDTIVSAGRSLVRIVDDVLDHSKIEAGKLDVVAERLEPRSVVHQVATMMSARAGEKGVELSTWVGEDVPDAVIGDGFRLEQVLLNLVSNALKFTDEGSVRLTCDVGEGDGVPLVFTVEDTGRGIAPEAQERLFTAYTQASAGVARRYGGTGLGLMICRQLVELMGGEIGLESRPGEGSTFSFTLPFEAAEAVDAAPERRARPASGLDILMAEDDESSGVALRELLALHGHEVRWVENGARAIDELRDRPFDIVLLDQHMPEMQGAEAARAIRAMPEPRRSVPILGITGSTSPDERRACLEAGMDALIPKPVVAESLYAKILELTMRA